jgi:hypothetical protein
MKRAFQDAASPREGPSPPELSNLTWFVANFFQPIDADEGVT